MSELILYQYYECPFCRKVDDAVTDLALRDRIEYRNVRQNPAYRDELRNLTGRTQVPCLVIDGQPMFESDDIVSYLYREFGAGRKPQRRSSPWG